jgi:delta1-piperideine-2-carboxylate reductase
LLLPHQDVRLIQIKTEISMTQNTGNPVELVTYTLDEVHSLCFRILTRHGLSESQAEAMSKVLTAGERDECRSHGVYRIPGCLKTVKSPKFHHDALPEVSSSKGPVLRVDAKYGFSCLALEMATPELVARTNEFGLSALVINNCFHTSALWYEVEELAKHGLVSLALSPSLRSVAPAGGVKPLFGTNPMAFGWPRPNGNPQRRCHSAGPSTRTVIQQLTRWQVLQAPC